MTTHLALKKSEPSQAEENLGKPPGVTQPSEIKRCPMCAESIEAQALVCRHCGFDYRTGNRSREQVSTNGLAVASMILGILWICWIGSILALVFGYIAKGQIDGSEGRMQGRGMAVAGIVLGWIGVGVLLLNLAIGFLPFALPLD